MASTTVVNTFLCRTKAINKIDVTIVKFHQCEKQKGSVICTPRRHYQMPRTIILYIISTPVDAYLILTHKGPYNTQGTLQYLYEHN